MRPIEFSPETIRAFLHKQKIATVTELMAALGTTGERTVFRKLAEMSYRTSYSHCGRYYTLDEIARFDHLGLWSHQGVRFSERGTLLNAAAALVDEADDGFFIEELDNVLHVSTKDALRKLVRGGRLKRELMVERFLYCSGDEERKRQQIALREAQLAEPRVFGRVRDTALLPDELRAAIVLFFGMLDEKQRRLFAGLEALKSGRGGDAIIGELLGMDEDTVARGRRELLEHDFEIERVRATGGGRKVVEKKRRK